MSKRIVFYTAGAVATAEETAMIKAIRQEIAENTPTLAIQNGKVAIGKNDEKPDAVAGVIPEAYSELPTVGDFVIEVEDEAEEDEAKKETKK